jgi:hypothetical protein
VQRDISIPIGPAILNNAVVTVNAALPAGVASLPLDPKLTGGPPSFLRLYMAPHGSVVPAGGTQISTLFLS